MKHIAVITSGMVGITNASFKLVSKLEKEGFKITYLCPINIEEKVKKQGINYVQLPEINFNFSFLNTEKNRHNRSALKKYLYHFKNIKAQYKEGVDALGFREYEKVLKSVNPDLAIIDQELHEAILTCLKLNIKVKLLGQFFSNFKRKNLPPIRTPIIPNSNKIISYSVILLAWLKIKLKIIGRLSLNKITLRNSRRSIIKYFIKTNNLNNVKLISRNFPSVFIYKNIPTLCMNIGEIDFPHKTPKIFNYIGAMVFDKRIDSEIPEELNKIFIKRKSKNKKLIYCSLTTMKESGDISFIKKVIAAVKDENEWLLVISLGGRLSANEFQNLPENVFVFKWVPQLEVLSQTDCSINHAGVHTINECIHFNVPMLIYSGKRFDQNGCSARIVFHNLGLRGDKDVDTPEIIHSKVNKVLNELVFKKKMDKINRIYKNYESKKITPYLLNK